MASTSLRRRMTARRAARDAADRNAARAESARRRPDSYILVDPDTAENRRADRRAEPERSRPADNDGRRWDLLVLGSLQASFTMFVAQAATSVVVADFTGSSVDVSLAAGFIPHVAVSATPSNLAALNSWPPAIAVIATSIGVLWNLWRRRDQPMFVNGWATGLLMSFNLLVIQLARHLVDPPMLRPWLFAQVVAVAVASSLIFVAFRPTTTRERLPATVPVRSKVARVSDPKR